MRLVVIGLSITSSWGNGHATTYRALLKALAARGHGITFLERDVPWYRDNRDMPAASWCAIHLYDETEDLFSTHRDLLLEADLVLQGSYVPDGVRIGHWLQQERRLPTAFYDIDTPITLTKLRTGEEDYLSAALVPGFDLYLSFAGGPMLDRLETEWGSPRARALYCAVDPEHYAPLEEAERYHLGYLGTWSADRQPLLEALLLEPARRRPGAHFAVAGPQYPEDVQWPANVTRIVHLPPAAHPRFYATQRFTLNITREAMKTIGWSPSVRLFEAAACAIPIISDYWEGLSSLFALGDEILIARDADDVVAFIEDLDAEHRSALGAAARQKVLKHHTADRRARDFEAFAAEIDVV